MSFSDNQDAYLPGPVTFSTREEAIDDVLQDIDAREREAIQATRAKMDLMNAARLRFAKAQLYEQIIEGQLFEGDDSVTLEVENEFKEFAEQRLAKLLGLDGPEEKKGPKLEAQEITVLKALASQIMSRSPPAPQVQEQSKPASLVVQPRPPTAPTTGSLAQPKRGRGRPPGTGKNQRAAAAAAVARTEDKPKQDPHVGRWQSQQESKPAPVQDNEEVRTVTLPNGERREVTVQKAQARPLPSAGSPKPLPMPSPQEQVAIAMHHGEAGAALDRAASSLVLGK
ncbi:hypothetical protein [Myxococcus phage Mx1]|nr:hypothetical protein [Myxococcus phage Mx1]